MPKKSDFTPEEWNEISPIIQQRIENGQCVSAISSDGTDHNVWELDDEEDLRLSREHMKEIRLRAALADAGITI